MISNRRVRFPAMLVLAYGLIGCGVNPVHSGAPGAYEGRVTDTDDCEQLESSARLRLGLIEDELRSGRPRAALAYLDGLPRELQNQPRATYLRAEAYRIVADYATARSLYRDLSTGCLSGAGYHGLGLVDAAERDVGGAVQHLYEARVRLSADPRVRNDYGYALLLAGRTADAKVEFETGAELSNRQPKVIRNLVLALLVEGDSEGALRYARSIAVSEADLDLLHERATEIRKQLVKDTSDEKIR